MKNKSVTQWFDVGDNPVRPGLYEVEFCFGVRTLGFAKKLAKWNGNRWERTKVPGLVWWMTPSSSCGDKWRGLAEKP